MNATRWRVAWLDAAGDVQAVYVFALGPVEAHLKAATYANIPAYNDCDLREVNWPAEYEEVGE